MKGVQVVRNVVSDSIRHAVMKSVSDRARAYIGTQLGTNFIILTQKHVRFPVFNTERSVYAQPVFTLRCSSRVRARLDHRHSPCFC